MTRHRALLGPNLKLQSCPFFYNESAFSFANLNTTHKAKPILILGLSKQLGRHFNKNLALVFFKTKQNKQREEGRFFNFPNGDQHLSDF